MSKDLQNKTMVEWHQPPAWLVRQDLYREALAVEVAEELGLKAGSQDAKAVRAAIFDQAAASRLSLPHVHRVKRLLRAKKRELRDRARVRLAQFRKRQQRPAVKAPEGQVVNLKGCRKAKRRPQLFIHRNLTKALLQGTR